MLVVHVRVQLLNHVQLFMTLWTVACQAPLSMGFPRQEILEGVAIPPLGDLLHPGIEPMCPASPTMQVDSLPLSYKEPPMLVGVGIISNKILIKSSPSLKHLRNSR